MIQQVFRFEERHDYLPENFLISSSNSTAYDAARTFTERNYALNIYGPESSGKTYLAHIAYGAAKGKTVHIVENIDETADEKDLFHLLNYAKEHGKFVLITSFIPVAEISFKLPDLSSRLAAINSIGIEEPDDGLIYMLFARLFAAKQLKVSDEVINYLAARSPRNFKAVKDLVSKVDSMSLASKKNITINLIKQIVS
jgi:chromosomal replication initiation ATPase DnaA